MLRVNHLGGFGAGLRAKPPIVFFRGSLFSDTLNVRTYSTTIDLGPEDPSRLIVVGTACVTGAGEEPTACTVDGAAATKAVASAGGGPEVIATVVWSRV